MHRDLKLENIFITENYEVKIGDFGFAKYTQNDLLSSFKGTPIHMAPEIFKAQKHQVESYDQKCDIWSLGTVLYELVFGTFIGEGIKTLKDL